MASVIKCISCNQRINLPPQASGSVTCPMCKTSQPVPEQQGENAPPIGNAPPSSSHPMDSRPPTDHNPYSPPQIQPEIESNFDTPKGRFPGWAVVGCLLVSILITFALLVVLSRAIQFAR